MNEKQKMKLEVIAELINEKRGDAQRDVITKALKEFTFEQISEAVMKDRERRA